MSNLHSADILVIEDAPDLRELLLDELTENGHSCTGAGSLSEARRYLTIHSPQLIISDLRLPDGEGLSLLPELSSLSPKPDFIAITAFGTIDQAVDALKRGANDFLTKPLDFEHLQLTVTRSLQHQRLEQELSYYRQLLDDGEFHHMAGNSPPMRQLFDYIRQIARADGPVLISGESGVGKELVARALHQESTRREAPFVAINCGGINASLLESELFGHAAGAFTGANKARRGLFASAHGGTLLLDEIGEMPLEMQASLLRTLQDGRVRPVGSNSEQALDVRVVAATNRDLQKDVKSGKFREDLYYRLETFALEVPPLRERGNDIEQLCARLLHGFNRHREQAIKGLTPEALALLKAYSFPGNIRELSNTLERAATFCHADYIDVEHLPPRIRAITPVGAQYWQPPTGEALTTLATVERDYVLHVLKQVDGNKRKAAQILGIGRRTLYRWLEDETDVPE